MKKLSPAFLTAIALSLAGFANLGFAERYETVFVKTEDTAALSHNDAVAYLKSDSCLSTQTLQIPQGEVAYVFSSGSGVRPGGTYEYAYEKCGGFVTSIVIDIDGLDSNTTQSKNWDAYTANFGASTNGIPISNIDSSAQPIAGPATVKIRIKPDSSRQSNSSSYHRWSYSGQNNWDFKASEGYVTFRIVGSEKEVSKKFATVIPENSSGNVDIILEQSTDLINWTAVNPGSFPPSTAKRFFRVRSQE
jgi:hypothetical protein